MMKDPDKIKDLVIDEYYGETSGESDGSIKSSDEYINYSNILKSSGEKLDVLNDDMSDFTVNTLSIIEKAEVIKEKRKFKMEFGLFLLVAAVILSLYIIAGLVFGSQTIIISQVVIIVIIPWIVVPIAVTSRKRGEA